MQMMSSFFCGPPVGDLCSKLFKIKFEAKVTNIDLKKKEVEVYHTINFKNKE